MAICGKPNPHIANLKTIARIVIELHRIRWCGKALPSPLSDLISPSIARPASPPWATRPRSSRRPSPSERISPGWRGYPESEAALQRGSFEQRLGHGTFYTGTVQAYMTSIASRISRYSFVHQAVSTVVCNFMWQLHFNNLTITNKKRTV